MILKNNYIMINDFHDKKIITKNNLFYKMIYFVHLNTYIYVLI